MGRQSEQRSDRTVSQKTRLPYPISQDHPPQVRGKSVTTVPGPLAAGGRARTYKKTLDETSRRGPGFRPNSGAEAFLVLDDDLLGKAPAPGPASRVRQLDSRTGGKKRTNPRHTADPYSTLSVSKTVQATIPNRARALVRHVATPMGQPLIGRTAPSTLAKSARPADPSHVIMKGESPYSMQEGSLRVLIPGSNSTSRNLGPSRSARRSKALPALPRDGSPLHRMTFAVQPHHGDADDFQDTTEKALRGRGSPTSSSAPHAAPVVKRRGRSSKTSFDSAEQTWSMIENMMNAVDEDVVRRARTALGNEERDDSSTTGTRDLPAKFSCSNDLRSYGRRPSDDRSMSEEDGRNGSYDILDYPSRPLTRCPSAASVFSIVIQPSRDHSFTPEGPDAYVAEEDMPSRIRRILQVRGHFGDASSIVDAPSREIHYHADLSLTIDALRDAGDGELGDIIFDKDDT
ncbi:hypothetical protein DFH11DRAFT_1564023 [Phellopilus nigrolimitatus]|nr:hypothetical protein DFH11DRAFT_1564023 [Phellopilus nigrolimitatus]